MTPLSVSNLSTHANFPEAANPQHRILLNPCQNEFRRNASPIYHWFDYIFIISMGLWAIETAVAGVMMTDFFFLRKQRWVGNPGWNWIATIAMMIGTLLGFYTQYINPRGLPAVQSLLVSGLFYYVLMHVKARVTPDQFTPDHLRNETPTAEKGA